ncbi:hypothetical protein QNM99_19535, partial [Pseudomonas sp. PCH446]
FCFHLSSDLTEVGGRDNEDASHVCVVPLTLGVCAAEPALDIESAMRSVTKECEGYARIQTDAKWEVLIEKARKKGKELEVEYKRLLYRMNVGECVLYRISP